MQLTHEEMEATRIRSLDGEPPPWDDVAEGYWFLMIEPQTGVPVHAYRVLRWRWQSEVTEPSSNTAQLLGEGSGDLTDSSQIDSCKRFSTKALKPSLSNSECSSPSAP